MAWVICLHVRVDALPMLRTPVRNSHFQLVSVVAVAVRVFGTKRSPLKAVVWSHIVLDALGEAPAVQYVVSSLVLGGMII